jgi:hypothetical protein
VAAGRAGLAALKRALALLLLVACSGGGSAGLADGAHVGTVVELDPTDFALTFDVRDEDDGVVRAPLDEDLRVRLLQPDGGLRTVPFEDWRAGFEPDDRSFFGTSRSTYELTVDDGRVVAIDEVP